jgi:hypothetical protein
VTPTRTLLAFAAWAAVAAAPAVVWAFTVGRMPPWWLTVAVGVGTFAVVEVGGRVGGRRRR